MSSLLYDALMLGRNKKVANEEYQVASGRKEQASFHVEEEYVTISNVISDGEFSVHLRQDVAGYMEIEVFCDDPFLVFDRKVLTTDEFTDGVFAFKFMVISDRLHNGRNYTSIQFRTSCQNVVLPVVVDNKIRIGLAGDSPRERYLHIAKELLSLKMGKTEIRQWIESSQELLNEIPGEDEASLFLMLLKAQVYITAGDDIHARNYIEHVGTQIPKLEEKNYDIYCYFIYLASLYEEVEGVMNFACSDLPVPDSISRGNRQQGRTSSPSNIMDMSALQKVRWVYSHNPSWWILFLLFYMDPGYGNDPIRRLEEMRDMFYDLGCISPLMYLESLKILSNYAKAMKETGPFEIQLLHFAVRHDCLDQELAVRAAQLVCKEDGNSLSLSDVRLAVGIFQNAYDRFGSDDVLEALCRMLIRAEQRDISCHRYFEKAVQKGSTDEEVLNYYIYTLDQTQMEQMDSKAVRYFLEHTELLYEYQAYIYANIITNRYYEPRIYEEARPAILRFAEYRMIQGHNDALMAVIYRDILESGQVSQVMKEHLFEVVCTKEVFCDNDRMSAVLVFHDELQVYQESLLRKGKACIRIYSSDAVILFKDATGNLYYNVPYKIDRLLETREYIDQCIRDVRISPYMLLKETFPILRAYKPPLEILQYFTSNQMAGQFRKSYEQELLTRIISYYVKNSRDEKVYDELLKLIRFDLSPDTRGQLIRIMLERDLIEEAYEQVREYGPCGLSPEDLARLAHGYIALNGLEEEPLLTYLCESGFNAGGFDEDIFEYLYRHYNGRMDLLIEIYRSCNAYHKEAAAIEERILSKAVSTGEHPEIVSQIFKRYYEEGGSRKVLSRYLEYRAGLYLYRLMTQDQAQQEDKDLAFFDYLEKDLMKGISFGDDSLAAYLLYRTELEDPDERQIRTMERVLKDLVRRGKMLEEFKFYQKYFELPSTLANNIIISAFSEDGREVPHIAYKVTGPGPAISGEEEMEEIFRRCYVKYFTLFYGEKVVFSMGGQENTEVRYENLSIRRDGSMYAQLDDLIRMKSQGDKEGFLKAAREYYMKQKLIERLL